MPSHVTMAPAKRADTSNIPPTRIASAATVLTTSPEGMAAGSAVPVAAA